MTINKLRIVIGGILAAGLVGVAGHRPSAGAPLGEEEVSYTGDIRPVIRNYCTTCHAGVEPEGGFDLESYAAVRAKVEKGNLLQRINDGEDPMPPAGLLPIHHRRLFKKWADGGFVNEGRHKRADTRPKQSKPAPPTITPIDVRQEGFEFLGRMQGHWVGRLYLMGQNHEWFAFDYRAIAPSHVHGIFEGGTMGNLFTSFFVTHFNGKHTIMARNGGVLNGIYRTSYFVLDKIDQRDGEQRYQFVDAYGGKQIMWIEVAFRGDEIRFESHTSRMGIRKPTLHMRFEGRRRDMALAQQAAKAVGFPKNVVDLDLRGGLPTPDWGPEHHVSSASYMWEEAGKSLVELGKLAKDPYRVDQMPHLAQLKLRLKRGPKTRGAKLLILLSQKALTDRSGKLLTQDGYLRADVANTILLFPEVSGKQDAFALTYLHPGTYYLTVVADMDGDSYPGPGDFTHPVRKIVLKPRSSGSITIDDLDVEN